MILVAMIPAFLVILILEIYNPFTFFILIIIPFLEAIGFYFLIQSQDDDAALRAIRRKIIAQDDTLKAKLAQEKKLKERGVDTIFCYSCGDEFVERENVCDKCGAPKPRCIVCGLDLSPETDPSDTVVITPCCSVYVHIEHMLAWLEVKEECPNCRMEIIREDFFKGYNF
jgi:hypothetical protein